MMMAAEFTSFKPSKIRRVSVSYKHHIRGNAMNGFIFYDGPSTINGVPIIGIATLRSKNTKTGNMVQTWILNKEEHPLAAINLGTDDSICGSCPLRGIIAKSSSIDREVNRYRGCYVNVSTAPSQVWKAFHRDVYPTLTHINCGVLQGRHLRIGSYGDPVAIPLFSWKLLFSSCTGKMHAGYTHQWRESKYQNWKSYIMASTHSLGENELANSLGWRTFRTLSKLEDQSSSEVICPASSEMGEIRQCSTCGACNGNASGSVSRRSIAIVAHGSKITLPGIRRVIANEGATIKL